MGAPPQPTLTGTYSFFPQWAGPLLFRTQWLLDSSKEWLRHSDGNRQRRGERRRAAILQHRLTSTPPHTPQSATQVSPLLGGIISRLQWFLKKVYITLQWFWLSGGNFEYHCIILFFCILEGDYIRLFILFFLDLGLSRWIVAFTRPTLPFHFKQNLHFKLLSLPCGHTPSIINEKSSVMKLFLSWLLFFILSFLIPTFPCVGVRHTARRSIFLTRTGES